MKFLGVFFFIFLYINSHAKQYHSIYIDVKFGHAPLQLDKKYITTKGDTIEINILKYYLSNMQFLYDGIEVWKASKLHHLIDFENKNTLTLQYHLPSNIKYNQIKFDIGIDSITQFAGALGGDLDPTNGMYWTWQNGYIHVKLEGKSSACNTPNDAFQFHLGGYMSPFNTLQTVKLPMQNKINHVIEMDIEKIFSFISLDSLHHIMSPSEDAVMISTHLPSLFTIKD